MSDVFNNSYVYEVTRDVKIQTVVVRQGPTRIITIEIITEEGCSTPTVLSSMGFTQPEINRLMNQLTAAL